MFSSGDLVIVSYDRIILSQKEPINWYYFSNAILLDEKLCIVMSKFKSKPWMNIYNVYCLHSIYPIGAGWLRKIED